VARILPIGGGATRPLPRDGGVEELHGDPTVGPHPKVWTRGQKWKKWCRRWRAGEAWMWDNPGGAGAMVHLTRSAIEAVKYRS